MSDKTGKGKQISKERARNQRYHAAKKITHKSNDVNINIKDGDKPLSTYQILKMKTTPEKWKMYRLKEKVRDRRRYAKKMKRARLASVTKPKEQSVADHDYAINQLEETCTSDVCEEDTILSNIFNEPKYSFINKGNKPLSMYQILMNTAPEKWEMFRLKERIRNRIRYEKRKARLASVTKPIEQTITDHDYAMKPEKRKKVSKKVKQNIQSKEKNSTSNVSKESRSSLLQWKAVQEEELKCRRLQSSKELEKYFLIREGVEQKFPNKLGKLRKLTEQKESVIQSKVKQVSTVPCYAVQNENPTDEGLEFQFKEEDLKTYSLKSRKEKVIKSTIEYVSKMPCKTIWHQNPVEQKRRKENQFRGESIKTYSLKPRKNKFTQSTVEQVSEMSCETVCNENPMELKNRKESLCKGGAIKTYSSNSRKNKAMQYKDKQVFVKFLQFKDHNPCNYVHGVDIPCPNNSVQDIQSGVVQVKAKQLKGEENIKPLFQNVHQTLLMDVKVEPQQIDESILSYVKKEIEPFMYNGKNPQPVKIKTEPIESQMTEKSLFPCVENENQPSVYCNQEDGNPLSVKIKKEPVD